MINEICKTISDNITNKLIKELKEERKEKEEYINIIYHLMNILEESNPEKALKYIKMKSVNQVLSPAVYKSLFGNFVMFEINKVIGDLKDWKASNEEIKLVEYSRLIRTIMYSSSKGVGKSKLFKDDKMLEEKHDILKARLTWFMIKTLQTNPKYGVVRIFIEKNEKCIGKPEWLTKEFIKRKHVFRYYVKKDLTCLQSNSKVQEEIQHQIIHNIDGIHGKSMNRIREKLRHDTLVSVLFMFEEDIFNMDLGENEPTLALDQIPEVNLDNFDEKVKESTVKRLWKAAKESTKDMIITVTYNAKVRRLDGNLRSKTIVRKINTMNVSLSILLKLTGQKNLSHFFCMQRESMKYVYILARLLWLSIKRKYQETELETCMPETDFGKECKEILNYVNVQTNKTRKNIMEEEVKKISELTFMYLNTEDDEEKEYDTDIEEQEDLFEDLD